MQDRNWGYKALIEGLGEGLNRREARMSQLAKQKELEDFYESQGLPRQLAAQPEFIQKEHVKNALRPKSIGEAISEYFVGNKHSMADVANSAFAKQNRNEIPTIIRGKNSQPLAVQIGSQIVPTDKISPETVQSIEMLEQQNAQNQQQESTFGTKAGNLLSGFGSAAIGLGTKSDLASLAAKGVGGLSRLGNKLNLASTELLDRNLRQITGDQEEHPILEHMRQSANAPHLLETLSGYLPTSENISENVLPALTKDTAVEKYVTPQNETDQWYHDIGNIARYITHPGKTIAESAANVLKGVGAAVSGDLAGWLTEKATGSETAGNFIKNGAYVVYSMFPGLPSQLASKAYNSFRENILKPAIKEGKTVNFKPYLPRLNKIKQKIEDTFPKGSLARNQLDAEVNKLQSLAIEKPKPKATRPVKMHPGEELLNRVKKEKELNTLLKGTELSTEELASIKDHLKQTEKAKNMAANQPKVKEVFKPLNPMQLWSNAKKMGESSYQKGLDKQAVDSGLYQEIIKLQKDALTDFANKFKPGSGDIFRKAEDFYKTSKDIQKSILSVKSHLTPRNLGAGAAIYMMSSFPTLLKFAGGVAATKFMTRMLKSPAVREEITRLIKAGASNNAALINKSMSRFNSQVENQLKKLPEKDQAQVREFIKLANAETMKERSK